MRKSVVTKTTESAKQPDAVSTELVRLDAENRRLRIQFESSIKQVNELNEFIQIMLNLSPFIVCIMQDHQLIFTNKAFSEAVGFSASKLRQMKSWEIIFEEDRDHVCKSIQAILEGEAGSYFMFRVMTAQEKLKWILGSVAPIHMHGKRAVLGNFVDLTEGRVMQLAYYDTLTGLPNRTLMMDRLEQAIVAGKRRGSRLALLFIDLDDFKYVNDEYGHETGDKLLIEVARALKEVVRRENDTISRLGGDEFLVLLTDIPQADYLDTIIRNLFQKFSQPLAVAGEDLAIAVAFSAGIALFPEHGENAEEMIRHADEAMYRVKKTQGKNGFAFFNPPKDVTK